jgi:hypothetical protein
MLPFTSWSLPPNSSMAEEVEARAAAWKTAITRTIDNLFFISLLFYP